MANNYESLPPYKTTFDILVIVTEKTKNFNNDYKHTIGKAIFNDSTELVHQFCKASTAKDKLPNIQRMIELLELIEITARLSKELRLLNTTAYADIINLTNNALKQANGWLKSTKSK